MWPQKVLIAWATVIVGVSAFHPYFPAYRCTDDGDCPVTSKRAAEVTVEKSRRSLLKDDNFTFKLKQRVSEVDLPCYVAYIKKALLTRN